MNGIGMALLLIVLVTVAMSSWFFLPRSHRISGSTDLDKMGEALAGARDAQQRLADAEGGLTDLGRPAVRPNTPAIPPHLPDDQRDT